MRHARPARWRDPGHREQPGDRPEDLTGVVYGRAGQERATTPWARSTSRGTAASGARSKIIPRFVFVLTTCRVASTAASTVAPTPCSAARSSGQAMAVALSRKSRKCRSSKSRNRCTLPGLRAVASRGRPPERAGLATSREARVEVKRLVVVHRPASRKAASKAAATSTPVTLARARQPGTALTSRTTRLPASRSSTRSTPASSAPSALAAASASALPPGQAGRARPSLPATR